MEEGYGYFHIDYELREEDFCIDICIGYSDNCIFEYGEDPRVIEEKLCEVFRRLVDIFIDRHNYLPFRDEVEEHWCYEDINRYSNKDYVDKLCKTTNMKSSRKI